MATDSKNKMSIEATAAVITRYFAAHDLSDLSDDAVFTVMGTGEEYRGPDAVEGMLNYFYHTAFEAKAEATNTMISEGHAAVEADFVGKHVGEFAGVAATGKQVRVPMCLVYDVENDKIVRARIYFETPAFLKQVGAM